MKNLYDDTNRNSFEKNFADPPSALRDTPFWAWNGKLEKKELLRQIEVFHKMGMGGFHMHARTGLETPYLSGEFFDRVEDCVGKAEALGMKAYLYDEDRWPSGFAGGIVTADPALRQHYLLFTREKRSAKPDKKLDDSGKLLKVYFVWLNSDGTLKKFRCAAKDAPAPAGAMKVFLYRMTAEDRSWYNHRAYLDTLDPKAVERFVEATHQKYFERFGKYFGGVIPSIFTDEPQFRHEEMPVSARLEKDVELPFTDDLPATFAAATGLDFFDALPEVLWELPDGKYSERRYRFHEHLAGRFADAFAGVVGKWCEKHDLRLTGHVLAEPQLASQTRNVGEAMRSYQYFQIPGVDMLCDWREYSTVKQAVSVSRQMGRGGVLSELDGVTDWDFPFSGHKGHGDWQAAMGVTLRVPHLSYYSMAGEAKRDYPASISFQSPWCEKYRIIADHFARVNAAMTRGRACVRLGVIHPIESFYLDFGVMDMTAVRQKEAEKNFQDIFEMLSGNQVDFDFISEALLPKLAPAGKGRSGKLFKVGEMAYDTILITPSTTLRSTTLDRLERFCDAGGRVIFAGKIPVCEDGRYSGRPAKLAERCEKIPYSAAELLDALKDQRDVEVFARDGGGEGIEGLISGMIPASGIFGQVRIDGDDRYCFVVNVSRGGGSFPARIKFRGEWQVYFCDTFTGKITPLRAEVGGGFTTLDTVIHSHWHMLFKLVPSHVSKGENAPSSRIAPSEVEKAVRLHLSAPSMPVRLDEPNVLLLDQAKWRVNDEKAWRPKEEILRLNNQARRLFGMGEVTGEIAQPWAEPRSGKSRGKLALRFEFASDVAVERPELALEQPEDWTIRLDGKKVRFADRGYFVDPCLRKTALPPLAPGRHRIELEREYTDKTNVEWMYLLGDFGVEVEGREAKITAPVRKLKFGPIDRQGLPFYTGNITYRFDFELEKAERLRLRIASRTDRLTLPDDIDVPAATRESAFAGFAGVLLGVKLDGKDCPEIAFAPFESALGRVGKGRHRLEIKLYNSRYNAFGALHMPFRERWVGPNVWRTRGDNYSYEYATHPVGLLFAPRLVAED